MIKTNALPFIPQRPPFVLIDNIVECDDTIIITDFVIQEEHILVENGQLSASGIMENIAQTCAARIGWVNQHSPVRIGVIGSISNLSINYFPHIGERLETTITLQSEIFDAMIVHAESRCSNQAVAQCDMKVFVL